MSTEFDNPIVSRSISKMYLKADLADVHFTFPNDGPMARSVPAHRNLLASASTVFKSMFYGEYGPRKEADINVKITASNASAFEEFLQFFYLPKISLSSGNIEEVVRLIKNYDMLDCLNMCFTSIKSQLTIENMVWGYQLAISMDNAMLKEFCEYQIRISAKHMLKSQAFLQCNRDMVEQILLQKLKCCEIDIFNACIAWAKFKCNQNGLDETNSKNLKNQLGPCFHMILFYAMEPEQFGNILLDKSIAGLFTSDELIDITRAMWTKQFKSQLFSRDPQSKRLPASNETNQLICLRKFANDIVPCYFQETESTLFSTDELILLKIIHFDVIHNEDSANTSIEAIVKIIEHSTNLLSVPDKTHLTTTCKIDNVANRIALDTPIVINPHKMYEIRLNITSNIHGYFHLSSYATEIKSDNVTIRFYQNSVGKNAARRGLVSQLIFSRI